MNDDALRFYFGAGAALPVVLVGIAIAIALLVYELRMEPDRRRRVGLVALRLLTVALAAMLALQPTWAFETFERVAGKLSILADVSRSMSVESESGTRGQIAASVLSGFERDAERDRVASFSFGATTRAVPLTTLARDYPTTDDETRLFDAVGELARGDEEGELGAVVVVSDGADRSPIDPAALARLGVRVHAVAIGAGDELDDQAIASIQADAVAFLRQPSRVRVRVTSGQAATLPVTLRRGDEVEREVMVDVPAGGEAFAEIPFTPSDLGRAVYRLTIPIAPGDAVPENNERAFLVRVTRDKLRVLLVAGTPSWDVRFLRSFLKRDPTIDLISFFILRTASDLTMAAGDELALIPFPTDELFREHLGSFDLVVFQNFDYAPYQMGVHLARIREYVQRGGGFAMVGGDRSFASGGYGETPIADVLPVTLPPSSAPETQTIVPGRFSPTPVRDLARHPLLALLPNPAENARAWAELAPLEGANVVTGLRGDGLALLVHERARTSGAPLPLLAVGTSGRGRVMTLATDTSYRWGIATGGLRGDASAYERFWDHAVRFLTRDPALDPAHVTTDRERYGPAARVRVSALLRDARYEPIANRPVTLSLARANGEPIVALETRTDADGHTETTFEGPAVAGGYRAVARTSGDPLVQAEEWFVVESGGDELADPRARPDLLRALAEATGGTFVDDPAHVPPLSSFDATRARSLGTVEHAPFATTYALLALIAAFVAEWVVRRRWGKR